MPSVHLQNLKLYAKHRGYLVARNPGKGIKVWVENDEQSIQIFDTVNDASVFLSSQPIKESGECQYRRVRRKGISAGRGGWTTDKIPPSPE
jgi:hypothetical protein